MSQSNLKDSQIDDDSSLKEISVEEVSKSHIDLTDDNETVDKRRARGYGNSMLREIEQMS
jgi:hypothetical protein